MNPNNLPEITPPEHVGITWLILISPILLLLSLAALEYIYKNPPEFVLAALEWLRMRKNLRVELSNARVIIARQKARIEELENERYGKAETIDYEDVNTARKSTPYTKWQERRETETLRPTLSPEELAEMRERQFESESENANTFEF